MGYHTQVVSIGWLTYIFAAIIVPVLVSHPTLAQVTPTPPTAAPSSAVASSPQPAKPSDLEREKLAVEIGKLEEQRKATLLTLFTIVVTALIGFGTVAYNIRNANYQAHMQAKLKAIEVVMTAPGPTSARQRLKVSVNCLGMISLRVP
jgi:hypothetical protein